jgi:hypothetical protein
MQIETMEQIARSVPTISALLAGFSFTMIRGLMFHEAHPRLTPATLICFIAAAAAMLVVTFNATYMLIRTAVSKGDLGQPGEPDLPAENILHLTRWVFYGGLASLLGGVGLLGWLHSRRVGMVGSAIILAAGCIILRTVVILGIKL